MTTKIEWCDVTWNPVTGCGNDMISESCLVIDFQKLLTKQKRRMKQIQKPPYHLTPEVIQERDELYNKLTALNQPRNRRVNKKKAGRLLDGME